MRLVHPASDFRREPMFQASFHTIVTLRVSDYAPPDAREPDLWAVAFEYLQSIEGAGRICWSAPFCGEVLLICTHQGSPFRGGFGMRIPMASPMRGKLSADRLTDEVDSAS